MNGGELLIAMPRHRPGCNDAKHELLGPTHDFRQTAKIYHAECARCGKHWRQATECEPTDECVRTA
jgi:hypothetical protein